MASSSQLQDNDLHETFCPCDDPSCPLPKARGVFISEVPLGVRKGQIFYDHKFVPVGVRAPFDGGTGETFLARAPNNLALTRAVTREPSVEPSVEPDTDIHRLMQHVFEPDAARQPRQRRAASPGRARPSSTPAAGHWPAPVPTRVPLSGAFTSHRLELAFRRECFQSQHVLHVVGVASMGSLVALYSMRSTGSLEALFLHVVLIAALCVSRTYLEFEAASRLWQCATFAFIALFLVVHQVAVWSSSHAPSPTNTLLVDSGMVASMRTAFFAFGAGMIHTNPVLWCAAPRSNASALLPLSLSLSSLSLSLSLLLPPSRLNAARVASWERRRLEARILNNIAFIALSVVISLPDDPIAAAGQAILGSLVGISFASTFESTRRTVFEQQIASEWSSG